MGRTTQPPRRPSFRDSAWLAEPRYRLATDVHACLSGMHVVVLDLRKNRYLAIDVSQAAQLRAAIVDWPASTSISDRRDPDVQAAVESMLREKLIVPVASGQTVSRPETVPPAARSLFENETAQPSLNAVAIARFTGAVLITRLELWLLPLRYVLRLFEQHRRVRSSTADLATLRRLVLCFMRIRPIFFSSRGSCLFTCLALARFLRGYRADCRIVFGVQDSPFAAHCWLVCADHVLNDTPEHVAQYTPILYV